MRSKLFINGIGNISAQPEHAVFKNDVMEYHQNIIPAFVPDFKKHIPAMQLRRMSRGIKMSLTAAKIALEDAGLAVPGAIITGTGQGAKVDTEKFLKEVLEQDEETLSPTSFIHSTHNTVGGQLALHLGCKGYNMTYSQNSASLESAFIDALLYLEEDPEIEGILIGGVEELSETITGFQKLDGQIKQEEVHNLDLFQSSSPGTIISEGAHFFSVSAKETSTSYARVVDVEIYNAGQPVEVVKNLKIFLERNNLSPDNIDLFMCGRNGDRNFDHFYSQLQTEVFKEVPQVGFKHLCGDHDTITGFAVSLACRIFREKRVPEILKLNSKTVNEPEIILIYNQYLGKNHSFTLLHST